MMVSHLKCVWGSIPSCSVAKPGSWQAALGLCHFSAPLAERNAPFVKCAENEAGLCKGVALSAEISAMDNPWLFLGPKCPLCALGLAAVTFALRWRRDRRLFFFFSHCRGNDTAQCRKTGFSAEMSLGFNPWLFCGQTGQLAGCAGLVSLFRSSRWEKCAICQMC